MSKSKSTSSVASQPAGELTKLISTATTCFGGGTTLFSYAITGDLIIAVKFGAWVSGGVLICGGALAGVAYYRGLGFGNGSVRKRVAKIYATGYRRDVSVSRDRGQSFAFSIPWRTKDVVKVPHKSKMGTDRTIGIIDDPVFIIERDGGGKHAIPGKSVLRWFEHGNLTRAGRPEWMGFQHWRRYYYLMEVGNAAFRVSFNLDLVCIESSGRMILTHSPVQTYYYLCLVLLR